MEEQEKKEFERSVYRGIQIVLAVLEIVTATLSIVHGVQSLLDIGKNKDKCALDACDEIDNDETDA